ncbi:MAG TPA: endonuclease/exonuclease/phosphatase family protein [Phycisphaerales bacterium]|nr:endonuclease/exonuclease/phosphatase family protein [Phycisphaerales bacterium]
MAHPLTSRYRRAHAGAAAFLALAGCAGPGGRQPEGAIPSRIQPVVLDGSVGEWPASVVMAADPWWLYLRWKVAGEAKTLQASDESLGIWIDADTNPATGWRPDTPPRASAMGVDVEIELSPRATESAGLDRGVRVTTHTGGGAATVPHAEIGFAFAPTYASEWYEGRLSRPSAAALGLPAPGVASAGLVTAILVLRDAGGNIVGTSEPFELDAPPASTVPARADIRIPERLNDGLRVVSWNVYRAKPMEDPGPFARVLRVLDPDVLLLQEWTSPARDIEAWLNASVPLAEGEWSVRTTGGWGVAVASRFPLEPLGHEELYLEGEEEAVRFAGALVDTPHGYLAASSIHLRCCGSSGSPEDQARISEAGAINRSLADALRIEPVPMRVIAGDFNLVGSRPPLDVMRNGLDADGSDLEIADARVLGDAAYMTWRDDGNAFTPGRLDFALVGEAGLEVVRAFVLDTRMLSDRALDTAGLDPTDSGASDHMPVVVDLRPR